jgi:hypothetical protein
MDRDEHEFFSGLFHHPMEKKVNTKKRKTKNAFQTSMSDGSEAIRIKRIHKARCTLTQRWYEKC